MQTKPRTFDEIDRETDAIYGEFREENSLPGFNALGLARVFKLTPAEATQVEAEMWEFRKRLARAVHGEDYGVNEIYEAVGNWHEQWGLAAAIVSKIRGAA